MIAAWSLGCLAAGRVRVLAAGILITILLGVAFSNREQLHVLQVEKCKPTASYVHLLIPASSTSANFCKTLYSAAVLDYPTPRILNWNREFTDPGLVYGGSHMAKIEGTLGFLRQLDTNNDDDLAIIVDGYDVWFQLPLSVLIERYHAINARADARIHHHLGSSSGIHQTVVFSAQKRCWPSSPDDPACYAVPDSELPKDTYGPRTDVPGSDQGSLYSTTRARYLNSGMVMGRVGHLRTVYERAAQKAKLDPNFGSDQGIFAQLFGEQEYSRHVLRSRQTSLITKFTTLLGLHATDARDNILSDALHPTYKRPQQGNMAELELGIGLDYWSELSQPTVFCEEDLAWLTRSPFTASQAPIDISKVSSTVLPADIRRSKPPFWTYNRESPMPSVPEHKSWDNVPLYTNFYTGQVPVTIHHNAHRDGLKSRLQTFWNETWYFPHLRQLLMEKHYSTRTPVATLSANVLQDIYRNNSGSKSVTTHCQETWWGPIDERNGVRIETGRLPGDWKEWNEICDTPEIVEEIFRDDRGPLKVPIITLDADNAHAVKQIAEWQAEHQPHR